MPASRLRRKPGAMPTESRREARAAAECRATARIALSVEVIDASAHGIRARASIALPVGTTLKIGLPGGAERHARIAWTDHDLIGCEFLAPLNHRELDHLLAAAPVAIPR